MDLTLPRQHDPDLTYAITEILPDFVVHVFEKFIRTDDLDGEIRNDFPIAFLGNFAVERPTLRRDKGHVGAKSKFLGRVSGRLNLPGAAETRSPT